MSAALDQLMRQISNQAGIAWNEETYDLGVAGRLSAAERATYIAKLIATAQQGDTHAILTLGHLQAADALPMLQMAATSTDPWAPTARRALVLLGHGADVVEQIAHDAIDTPATMGRVAAVMDLAKIGGPVAIAALERAIADADYAVRGLAWDGLMAVRGFEPSLRGPSGQREKTTLLELLRDFLASDLESVVKMGVDETRAITRGAGPEPWIPDPHPELSGQILAAIVDPEVAFPVDDIAAQLTGVPRRWAEASILLRLDQATPDERAPDALARLAATWTVPALAEVAAKPDIAPTLRASCERAIATLTTS